MAVWRAWPFAFLMLMAGLQNIPDELYEAAAIDGAGIVAADPPDHPALLRPVNQVLVLVLFLWTFNDFNTPFVLFGADAAEVGRPHLDPHLPDSFVTWNFGSGSAMSVLLLLFLLVVTGVLPAASPRPEDAVDA